MFHSKTLNDPINKLLERETIDILTLAINILIGLVSASVRLTARP